MNVSKLIHGPRSFMSVSIFEALIEALRGHPEGIGVFCPNGSLRDEPITLKIGSIEIPIEDVLEKCNETAIRSFDSEVAERVKEMVFSTRLETVKRHIDEACEKIDGYTRDLNYDVGRMIEVEFGPNSNWSESSGSC